MTNLKLNTFQYARVLVVKIRIILIAIFMQIVLNIKYMTQCLAAPLLILEHIHPKLLSFQPSIKLGHLILAKNILILDSNKIQCIRNNNTTTNIILQ